MINLGVSHNLRCSSGSQLSVHLFPAVQDLKAQRQKLGNFLEARKYDGLHLMHLDYLKKYGKVFAISLGGKPSLVVADPELLKQIMIKDFPNFRNRFRAQTPGPLFNKNLLNARDDTWKRIRNTLTPTFSAGKMKLMVPLIEKSCDTLLEKLEKIADSGRARSQRSSIHVPNLTDQASGV